MAKVDDEAVSLAEITDLAWAFVKDRFPQREARARLATALGALMGGSYRQLGERDQPQGRTLDGLPVYVLGDQTEHRDRLESERTPAAKPPEPEPPGRFMVDWFCGSPECRYCGRCSCGYVPPTTEVEQRDRLEREMIRGIHGSSSEGGKIPTPPA